MSSHQLSLKLVLSTFLALEASAQTNAGGTRISGGALAGILIAVVVVVILIALYFGSPNGPWQRRTEAEGEEEGEEEEASAEKGERGAWNPYMRGMMGFAPGMMGGMGGAPMMAGRGYNPMMGQQFGGTPYYSVGGSQQYAQYYGRQPETSYMPSIIPQPARTYGGYRGY